MDSRLGCRAARDGMRSMPAWTANRATEDTAAGKPWLLTFNDLTTLLLTFFVLVLSMSEIDETTIRDVSASLRERMPGQQAPGSLAPGAFDPFLRPFRDPDIAKERNNPTRQRLDWEKTVSRIRETAAYPAGVRFLSGGEALLVEIDEGLLFDAASRDWREEAAPLLRQLSRDLRTSDSRLAIALTGGDACDEKDGSSRWDRASETAMRIARRLIEEGQVDPLRISLAGGDPCAGGGGRKREGVRAGGGRIRMLLRERE